MFRVCRGGPSSTAVGLWLGQLRSLQRGLGGQWAMGRGPWGAAGEGSPPRGCHRDPLPPQLAGCCLAPPSPAQPCHNLPLRDLSWQGTSLEINSDDIPANSRARLQNRLFIWAGEGGAGLIAPCPPPSDPGSGLLRSETGPGYSLRCSSREGQRGFVEEQEQKQGQGNLPRWAPSQLMPLGPRKAARHRSAPRELQGAVTLHD